MTVSALDSLLKNNVLEIRFARRVPVPGKSPLRRMICTKSYDLLNSTNGKLALNYRPPKGPMRVDEGREGVCVVWDILMQDYRTVPAETVTVVNQIPIGDEFWKYFNQTLYPMSKAQKIQFMDS